MVQKDVIRLITMHEVASFSQIVVLLFTFVVFSFVQDLALTLSLAVSPFIFGSIFEKTGYPCNIDLDLLNCCKADFPDKFFSSSLQLGSRECGTHASAQIGVEPQLIAKLQPNFLSLPMSRPNTHVSANLYVSNLDQLSLR